MAISAADLVDQVVAEHEPEGVYALLSGGHDSLTSTSLVADHPSFRSVVHIATGIGIPQTTEFVEAICAERGWPLVVLRPEAEYETLVLERGGFPKGPKSHSSFYWHLKQRPLERFLATRRRRRGDRFALVTGIRRGESRRRMLAAMSVPIRRDTHNRIWISPILDWSALDCGRHLEAAGLRRNPVVDLLHRSGECLCGALARESEIDEIDRWYPDVGARIHALERRCALAGLAATKWASAKRWHGAEQLALCWSCEVGQEP